ncbi:MAG: RNA methyltransferase, partial [Chitinophagaceae bacterium]
MSVEIPKELLASLQNVPGFNEAAFKEVHASGAQLISVRLNPAKVPDISAIPFLQNILAEKVAWNSHGYYLKQRPLFT